MESCKNYIRGEGEEDFTAKEADAGTGAAADAEAEAGSDFAELLGGDLRQPPEEAFLTSNTSASQLLPHRVPLHARRPLLAPPEHDGEGFASRAGPLLFLMMYHRANIRKSVRAFGLQIIHANGNVAPASQPTYRQTLAQPSPLSE